MLKSVFEFGLTGLSLAIDGIVYWLVSKLFSLYAALAGAEIIQADFFTQIMDKFYVIVGIFMLFVVAYSLLKSLVNPDNLSKETGKIVTNIIVSIILIGVIPIIFDYARDLQNVIVEEKIIESVLLGEPGDTTEVGSSITLNTLLAFIDMDDSVEGNLTTPDEGNQAQLSEDLYGIKAGETVTWGDWKTIVSSGQNDNFRKLVYFAEPIHEGEGGATYTFILSTICGAFLAYVVLSFCIDLGIRVIKLAFYQIIAPIPILMRIIPEKKSVFDNWVKASIATYMEVFIRIFIMALMSALCMGIFSGDMLQLNNNNLGLLGKVIVVLGIFAFAKQAPKLISDVIGIDSGNIKLGIGGKLAAGGAFGLAAMLAGGFQAGANNLTHGFMDSGKSWKSVNQQRGFMNKFKTANKAFWQMPGALFSGAFGVASGAARSAKDGFAAKNYKDVAKAAGEGATNAITARNKGEAYRAANGGFALSTIAHQEDALKKIGRYLGINSSAEGLKKTLDVYQKGFDFKKQLEDLALKKSTQAKVYDQQIDALNQAPIKREDYDTQEGYSAALIERAAQIDQLKDAKAFEVMKEINTKLGDLSNPKNSEYAQIVTSFDTFKRQNANLLSGIKDLTNEGWNSAWNSVTPLNMSKDDLHNLVSDMKKEFRYMENHTEFERNKNETAAAYAKFIQQENEKK